MTAFVVVGTGNHWVLDVVGGWAVVAAAWLVVEIVVHRRGAVGDRVGSPTS